MLLLESKEFFGHHDALVINFVAEVLKVSLSDLHSLFEGLLFDALCLKLLDDLALFLMRSPVLRAVLAGAIPRLLAVPTHKYSLSITYLAALEPPEHNQSAIQI